MLVLTRRLGEEIVIDGDIRVTVVAVQGDKVRLGVTAPKCVPVDRAEVHARREEFLPELPRLRRALPGAAGLGRLTPAP